LVLYGLIGFRANLQSINPDPSGTGLLHQRIMAAVVRHVLSIVEGTRKSNVVSLK
jgi:hypothetical protein